MTCKHNVVKILHFFSSKLSRAKMWTITKISSSHRQHCYLSQTVMCMFTDSIDESTQDKRLHSSIWILLLVLLQIVMPFLCTQVLFRRMWCRLVDLTAQKFKLLGWWMMITVSETEAHHHVWCCVMYAWIHTFRKRSYKNERQLQCMDQTIINVLFIA